MNDYAWSVLQPRLLAQLEAAEQAEVDHVARVASLPAKSADRKHQEGNTREVKEAMDRDWEESQRPTRDNLSAIAEDFITQNWDRGSAVTFENSPKFAADLLTYVRHTFYASRVKEGSPRLSEQEQASNGQSDIKPSLVLDDMKWVYDNKLRPLIEQFRRDVFLCSGSDCDRNTRFYGFEGIVQHYGARHTNSFSVGNVVVAWREAEWPEEPPFHPDPISVKHAHHTSASGTGFNSYYSGFSRAGTSTPHMPSHLPQASPGPLQYGGQYNGPFPPPQAASSATPGFAYTQLHAPPADSYSYPSLGPAGYAPQVGPNSYMQSPATMNPTVIPAPVMLPPAGQGVADTLPNGIEDVTYSTSSFDKQVSIIIRTAQDVWKQTSGIKDIPNSLRIYVLLHRIISKFHVEFNHEPNLTHINDALSNHETPRALKHAPGLSCKACQMESRHLAGTFNAKSEERKTYTVLNLLSHFRTQHLPLLQTSPSQGQLAPPMDWKEDMIELPSERFISGLIHAPGMDDEKLLVIATVFPSLFPTPLPKMGTSDSHRLASPTSSGTKDSKDLYSMTGMPSDVRDQSGHSAIGQNQTKVLISQKRAEDDYDSQHVALTTQEVEASSSTYKKHLQRDSPPTERWQRYYTEPRYYVSCLLRPTECVNVANKFDCQMSTEPLDDGYAYPREYVEYRRSPRVAHAGPVYEEFSGRRSVFPDQEAQYGPPPEGMIYTHPHDGNLGREPSNFPRQARYYEENSEQPEYRYIREPRSREASPSQAQSAADRFLDELVPDQASGVEPTPPSLPLQSGTKSSAPVQDIEDNSQYTPPPPTIPSPSETEDQRRSLAAPPPKPASAVSNGSRYNEYRPDGRYNALLDPGGRPRRAGPHRRRDRPFEQRMPSRFFRYMSIARDDPYGRGSSMSRSQSRRYEEQRRRLDLQETPHLRTDRDYRPVYSRDTSVDHHSPEHDAYQHTRLPPREYVSIQDRLQPYSPPRYRYDESRGPQSVYVDEYGQPLHEYEIIRVRGDSRQPRNSYHQPPQYEPEHYRYVPVTYERPPPKRFTSRSDEYMFYEEKERQFPKRPATDAESEVYEPPPPEIKIENVPASLPDGA